MTIIVLFICTNTVVSFLFLFSPAWKHSSGRKEQLQSWLGRCGLDEVHVR